MPHSADKCQVQIYMPRAGRDALRRLKKRTGKSVNRLILDAIERHTKALWAEERDANIKQREE